MEINHGNKSDIMKKMEKSIPNVMNSFMIANQC